MNEPSILGVAFSCCSASDLREHVLPADRVINRADVAPVPLADAIDIGLRYARILIAEKEPGC